MTEFTKVEQVVKLLKELNESELGHIETLAGTYRYNLKMAELDRLKALSST